MNFRTLKLRKNPECPVCGASYEITALIDYDQFCGIESPKASRARLRWRATRPSAGLLIVDGIKQISA